MTACRETLPTHCLIATAILGLLLRAAAPMSAQEVVPPPESTAAIDKQRARRLEQMLTAATDYELWRGRDDEQRLVRIERPVLRWSNPLRSTGDGAVFIWADEQGAKRPAAVMCIYCNDTGGVDHEWQSLALEPIRAAYRGASVWRPQTAGSNFTSWLMPRNRLQPLRRGAWLRCTGCCAILTPPSAKQPRQRDLRALTHPIYRYGDAQSELVDGFVFAFAQATDPEILLLLGARRQGTEPASWWWAAARMSGWHLDLRHRGELVWTVDSHGGSDDREPRRVFHRGPE